MFIGTKIKLRREELHMSQEALAEKLATTRQTIYNWENGLSKPNSDNICDLTKALDCSYDYLLNDDSDPNDDHSYDKNNNIDQMVGEIYGGVKKNWHKIYFLCFIIGGVTFLMGTIWLIVGLKMTSFSGLGSTPQNPIFSDMNQMSNDIQSTSKTMVISMSFLIYTISAILFIIGLVLLFKERKSKNKS